MPYFQQLPGASYINRPPQLGCIGQIGRAEEKALGEVYG